MPDHRKDRDGRLCDTGKLRHLPEAGDPHLDYGDLMLRLDARDGHRHADLVVEIPLGLEHAVARAEHGGDHLLCGGLADAAGDAHHGQRERRAVGRGDPLNCLLHIVHQQHGPGLTLRDALGQAAGRTFVKGRRDVIVAVHLLTPVGDEEVAGLHPAAVDHDTAELPVPESVGDPGPAGCGSAGYGKVFHVSSP